MILKFIWNNTYSRIAKKVWRIVTGKRDLLYHETKHKATIMKYSDISTDVDKYISGNRRKNLEADPKYLKI